MSPRVETDWGDIERGFSQPHQYVSIVPMQKSTKSRRGFTSMKPEIRSRIASLGGKAAHAKGTAHRFTHTEAVRDGKRGTRPGSPQWLRQCGSYLCPNGDDHLRGNRL